MSWNFQFRIKTIIRQRLIVSVWWILETTQTVGLIITLMPEWLYTRNEVARLANPTDGRLSVSYRVQVASQLLVAITSVYTGLPFLFTIFLT